MNSYEIIADAVRNYVIDEMEHDHIIDYCYLAHFYQKYDRDDKWEECTEVLEVDDLDNIIFMMDFCEGQTCVKDITIMPLSDIGKMMEGVKQ